MDQKMREFLEKATVDAKFKVTSLQTFHRCLHLAKEVAQLKLKEDGEKEAAEAIIEEIDAAHSELVANVISQAQANGAFGGGSAKLH